MKAVSPVVGQITSPQFSNAIISAKDIESSGHTSLMTQLTSFFNWNFQSFWKWKDPF